MFQHQDASKHNRGFTLVEALVALTLLTVGLIPAFLQAASAVRLTGQIRNSLVAGHLAQEGVEVVRAIRDANWFASRPFDTNLTCAAGCLVQFDSTAVQPMGANPPLKIDPLNGLYQYSNGPVTNFTRRIIITKPSSHEMKIISEIGWTESTGAKTFSLEYHLFNWLP